MAIIYGSAGPVGGGDGLWIRDALNILNANHATGGVNIGDESDLLNVLTAHFIKNNFLIDLVTDNNNRGQFRIDKNGAGAGLDIIRALMFASNGNVSGLEAITDWVQLQSDHTHSPGGSKLELRVGAAFYDYLVNGGTVFKIGNDGAIYTNQCNATGALTTLSFAIPVKDEIGNLKGFIEVRNL